MYAKRKEERRVARTRNIKPAFFDNDVLGSLDPLIRLLFIGLWCIADRDGRLEDRPRRIKKTLLGYDDATAEETDGMLEQLAENGFIIRYEANGERYIQIVNFNKHQNPNMKEKSSEIPPPPGFDTGTYQEQHQTSTVQTPCRTDEETTPAEPTETPDEPKNITETRFNAFWEAYPNKKAKENARKAWRKLKPNAALFEKIMRAVDIQKRSDDWTKNNGRFIPYPATWLNGGYWENEIKEVNANGETGQLAGNGNASSAFAGGEIRNGTAAGFKSE